MVREARWDPRRVNGYCGKANADSLGHAWGTECTGTTFLGRRRRKGLMGEDILRTAS